MKILGVETTCDETGIALFDTKLGLIAHTLHSQIDLHAQYGGVVPELASRDHINRTISLMKRTLERGKVSKEEIDGVAYAKGPGLIGAILAGASIARSFALGLGIPAIGVHHMEAHLLAPMLEDSAPSFPFVALLVSGGHTLLVCVTRLGQYEILGESLDDAAGEAFDKVAQLLGLPYPGGPALAKLAEQGDATRFTFPRPMTNKPGLHFSFSGLKTCVSNTFSSLSDSEKEQSRADIASAFQEAVVDTLFLKSKRALEQTGLRRLVVAGGVSANCVLRERFSNWMNEVKGEIFFPRLEFCTDNGAMIAYAGSQRLLKGEKDDLEIHAQARWPLDWLVQDDY